MRDFLKQTLSNLFLYGIDQVSKLTDEQISLLLDELTKEASRPEWTVNDEIKKKWITDGIASNKPVFYGLNIRWVRELFNENMKIYGIKPKEETEKVDWVKVSNDSIKFWEERKDLDPDGIFLDRANENLERAKQGLEPIQDSLSREIVSVLQEAYKRQIAGSSLDVEYKEPIKGAGQRLKESMSKEIIEAKPKD